MARRARTVSSSSALRRQQTALLAVMRALAVELARHQVRCNSLLPGWTDTELLAGAKTREKFVTAIIGRTPVRRWATPHDFETIGAFLADPSLIFHTGDSMVVGFPLQVAGCMSHRASLPLVFAVVFDRNGVGDF